MTHSLFPVESHLGLLTDLYELTMAAGYFVHGVADQRATFELWIRRLPEERNYLVTGGLEQAVDYLQHLSFATEQIEFLQAHPAFQKVSKEWFQELAKVRFDGDLWAAPEGTLVFGGEPLLRVTGPLMVAQIVETFLMTTITYQTLVASKAARVVTSAGEKAVFDYGSRRAHGPQAGLLAARASYLGGCQGTSNTEAGRLLGIPTVGTQAHSWVMAWGDEIEAFRKFGQVFPTTSTMLVDTYDTIQGVRKALASGTPMQAVRLDSGDLAELSKAVRKTLDEAGRPDVKIVASGDLNEYRIQELLNAGAPIDGFGVGTELVTSRDDPTLSTVYKLVEQETPQGTIGPFKLSNEKQTYPFAKQIYRKIAPDGTFQEDWIVRATEKPLGEPLLVPVLNRGKLVNPLPSLEECRNRCREQQARLPKELLKLERSRTYPVRVSQELERAVR
jgi:nicotinate phosphoribosyltransferase